jgi:hypothetical protein
MNRATQYVLWAVIALAVIPLLHLINILVGDELFMGFFTWFGYHIHAGLVGFIALCLGLFLLVFTRVPEKGRTRTRHTLLLISLTLIIFGTFAMLWDWEDVINGNFLSGIRS